MEEVITSIMKYGMMLIIHSQTSACNLWSLQSKQFHPTFLPGMWLLVHGGI